MAREGEPPVGSPKKRNTKTRRLSRWQKSGGPRPSNRAGHWGLARWLYLLLVMSVCYALFSDIEKSVQHLWEFTFCCFECASTSFHLLPAMQERTRKKMVCLALWLGIWWDSDGYSKSILILTLLEYVRQPPEQEGLMLNYHDLRTCSWTAFSRTSRCKKSACFRNRLGGVIFWRKMHGR